MARTAFRLVVVAVHEFFIVPVAAVGLARHEVRPRVPIAAGEGCGAGGSGAKNGAGDRRGDDA